MSYQRVIPRDLFNEAKLLKCLGQLSLILHDGVGVRWPLELTQLDEHSFDIDQRDSDGGLVCNSLRLTLKGETVTLYTAYNSKGSYPLIFEDDATGETGSVFTDDGKLDTEFTEYCDSKCLTV
jgi:hypothetical protein